MDKDKIIEAIKGMTVLELNELVKACEEEFGVSAAAPVAVAGAVAGGDAGAEQTEFNVVLAADVVLMNSKLSDVSAAIRLSRATLRNIHENLFWAFIYNVIGIPLAAGAWIHLTGWTMNPMFGALAMRLFPVT